MDRIDSSIRDIVKRSSLQARGKSISRRRLKSPTKPSAAWTTPSRVGIVQGTALSIVFSTIGCAHARSEEGGCTMCSYLLDGASKNPTDDEFLQQFRSAMHKLEKQAAPFSVKIYTSGSFLDPDEVPEVVRRQILEEIAQDKRIHEVVLESRPEYVNDEALAEVRYVLGDRTIELGIGLESSSDLVRSICVNKNFSLQLFKRSVEISRKYNVGTRAYVLLKPPFMTERSALLDAQRTVTDALSLGATTISLNPVNVQRYTLVEHLWEKGRYRPPWLWSVIEVLKHASLAAEGHANIICDPVAAGKIRGVHNCGKCDKAVTDAIREFSLTQDVNLFSKVSCDCVSQWHHILEHEDASLLIHR